MTATGVRHPPNCDRSLDRDDRLKARANLLEELLRAEPLIEFSDEHCRAMREQLVKLFRNLGTPPVGKDGSGGAAGDELSMVLTVGRSLGTARPEA